MAAATRCGCDVLAPGRPGRLRPPCPPLWHPAVTGRIAGRRPRGGALRPALLAVPSGPARAEHPSATALHHRGRLGGYRGRKPAARPARAHCSRPGLGGRHHLLAPARRALVLLGHLARYLFTAGWPAPARASPRQGSSSTPTAAANTPAQPAAPASPKPGPYPTSAGRATTTTMPYRVRSWPKPVGAPSKPNCCLTALPLLRSKKPAWKWLIASIPALISTGAIPPWVNAHPTHLNRI